MALRYGLLKLGYHIVSSRLGMFLLRPWSAECNLSLEVKYHAVEPAGWPPGLKLRIAVLADLHAGEPHMTEHRIHTIVDRTNEVGADLIILLGDYVATHRFVERTVSFEVIARVLARLQAPLGTHAILGNHDWWVDEEAQSRGTGPIHARRALENAGIPVYENEGIRLTHEGHSLWLLGLGDQNALRSIGKPLIGVHDLKATVDLMTDDAPAILLAHEPEIFPMIPKRISLTIAGHTHGGQIRLLGWSPLAPSKKRNRFRYGHFIEDGRHLIVSGGLGCSILPVRIGMSPEITVIELASSILPIQQPKHPGL